MTAFSKPEPREAGSTCTGCSSDTARVAPIGRADEGAIDSVITMCKSKRHEILIRNRIIEAPTSTNTIYRKVIEAGAYRHGCETSLYAAIGCRIGDVLADLARRSECRAVHVVMNLMPVDAFAVRMVKVDNLYDS